MVEGGEGRLTRDGRLRPKDAFLDKEGERRERPTISYSGTIVDGGGNSALGVGQQQRKPNVLNFTPLCNSLVNPRHYKGRVTTLRTTRGVREII